jgi:GxxExxY protein
MENDLVHNDVTRKIIESAFEIYNVLGFGLKEKVYQRAMAKDFDTKKLLYTKEQYGKIVFQGAVVGRYFIDFLVEGKVAVELKVRNELYNQDVVQLLNYLKSKDLKVGLLIAFTSKGVKLKRVVN